MPDKDERPEWPSDDHDAGAGSGNDGGAESGDPGTPPADQPGEEPADDQPTRRTAPVDPPTVWLSAPPQNRPQQSSETAQPAQPPQTAHTSQSPQSQQPPQPPAQQHTAQRPPDAQPYRQSPQPSGQSTQQQAGQGRPPGEPRPIPRVPPQQPLARAPVEIRPAGVPAVPMRIEPDGAQHPAAAKTGDGDPPEPDPPAEPEPKPRRRRGLLLTGLAVLVLVALGVALALPGVSNRLGLPWAPNAPKGDPPEPVAVSRQLHGPSASAPAPTAEGIAAALAGPAADPALGTLTGSVIDPASGRTLWERSSDRPITPASTTKVLTAAAALLALDHDKRLSTKVVQGPEPGTVVLVAGGDVTLSSLPRGQESVYSGAAHLDDLVEQVRETTGGNVREVRLDLSAFTGSTTAPGWSPGDAPSTYAAPVVAGMLDGGRSDPTDDGSARVGNPGAVLAQEFAGRLGARVGSLQATAPQDARVLGEVRSAPLTELVDHLLLTSDNLLADAIQRQVAIATGHEPSFAGAGRATLEVLRRNGFDVQGATLVDGSGLSTDNKLPARLLADVLSAAAAPDGTADERTLKLRPLLGGLPVAGGSGTLEGRYDEGAATQGRGWVRAKTGTISSTGTNTLAGLVLDSDGRVLVFALLTAGSDTSSGRAALDTITATLRGCGCR